MTTSDHGRLMAAAIYEIRLLLSAHLGSESDSDPCVRLAAHLAYALHNDALAMLEGDGDFDLDSAQKRIKTAESIVGDAFADNGGYLTGK